MYVFTTYPPEISTEKNTEKNKNLEDKKVDMNFNRTSD